MGIYEQLVVARNIKLFVLLFLYKLAKLRDLGMKPAHPTSWIADTHHLNIAYAYNIPDAKVIRARAGYEYFEDDKNYIYDTGVYSLEIADMMMSRYCFDLDYEHLNSAIAGDRNLRGDGVAHLINDAIDGEKFIREGREREYVILSGRLNNVDIFLYHTDKSRFSVWFVAQRDLKAGEELFYHYGVEYWRKQLKPSIALPDIECISLEAID